jgi:uncharacterized protein YodC (DUF2158 family)
VNIGAKAMRTITMLDEEGKPINRTYPRRAENLVKKGRARWVDSSTIEITPSQETEDGMMVDVLEVQGQNAAFKVGDVVNINSGGFPMTVLEIRNEGVLCRWLGDDRRYRQDLFPPESIVEAVSSEEETSTSKDYFTMAMKFIADSPIDPLIKNDQVIRLFEACKGVPLNDLLNKLTKMSCMGDETAREAIQAIHNLEIPYEQKLTALTDIAKTTAFSKVQNMESVMTLVGVIAGKPCDTEEQCP